MYTSGAQLVILRNSKGQPLAHLRRTFGEPRRGYDLSGFAGFGLRGRRFDKLRAFSLRFGRAFTRKVHPKSPERLRLNTYVPVKSLKWESLKPSFVSADSFSSLTLALRSSADLRIAPRRRDLPGGAVLVFLTIGVFPRKLLLRLSGETPFLQKNARQATYMASRLVPPYRVPRPYLYRAGLLGTRNAAPWA